MTRRFSFDRERDRLDWLDNQARETWPYRVGPVWMLVLCATTGALVWFVGTFAPRLPEVLP